MILIFFKNIFIYVCNIFITLKLLNYKNINSIIKYFLYALPVISTFITCILKTFIPSLSHSITLLFIWIIFSIITNQPKNAFISTYIGFGISYVLFSIIAFIVSILIFLLPIEPTKTLFYITILLSGTLQIRFSLFLCNIKRFRHGIPLLFTTHFINKATLTCLFLIFILSYIQLKDFKRNIVVVILIIFILTLAFLIHWWQAQITKSYKQSLVMRELDSLRIELEEKDKEISRLKAQNEELGRLIHHDNKRIPAMETAVCEYLVSDFSDINTMKERANVLRLEIESLSRNRSNTLKEIYTQKNKTYSTEISTLDTLLNYMDKRATDAGIQFNVHNTLKLETYIPKLISVEDFTHVLSDLLENAIIATEYSDNKTIQLQFYVSAKHFVIEVADSGIPFEAKSIVNFGLSKLTTHEDTGGSGIGLMDIWKIKESCGASLHIEEYETPAPFTKKLSLVFNHKNIYSVRTYRAEEITALSKRNDLRIYSFLD